MWNFLSNQTTSRGTRIELDVELPSGTIIAVTNRDYDYGEVQYWGVVAALEYQLGTVPLPVIYNERLLYQRTHVIVLTSDTGSTVQPLVYCPEKYKQEFLTVGFYQWVP